ncbi:FRG domain-containing protein [Gimesia sp.]|uniref:FRG domain-containing protein n=1 Tax=Gimesia sp. TaxID=2024833 RepID=UPI003A950D34
MSNEVDREWQKENTENGIRTVTFGSWMQFQEYINTQFIHDSEYVFRGHRCDNWLLEPTLSRLIKAQPHLASLPSEKLNDLAERHYFDFQYAIRGRSREQSQEMVGDYLWALGQHYGLATPLLDWTNSPFLAAFFAFVENGEPQTEYRVIYAIAKEMVEQRCKQFRSKGNNEAEFVYFFSPLSQENPRLVNQGGLFSRCPLHIDLETWVRKYHDEAWEVPVLLKLRIPNLERDVCLRSLSRMNINHLTAFPDLFGASQFCNMATSLKGYSHHLGRPRPARLRLGRTS